MSRHIHSAVIACACVLLGACGGGGDNRDDKVAIHESGTSMAMATASLPDVDLRHCLDTNSDTTFNSVAESLGLCYQTEDATYFIDPSNPIERDLFDFSGGLAYADIDNDGTIELYVTHGGGKPSRLFTYQGGAFEQISDNNGIHPSTAEFGGYFVDLNGDSWVDFISVQHGGVEIFVNEKNGRFVENTDASRIYHNRATLSAAASDFDLDGDIDLAFAHWGTGWRGEKPLSEYLWLNDGTGRFRDRSPHLPIVPTQGSEHAFTPIFADIDSDGYPDLLMAGDFESSQVFRNVEGRWFEDITTSQITDKNGMGAAVGDYDRDGDLDWFVSSIWGDPGTFGDLYDGNRLYRNRDGVGGFEDVTRNANVRYGGWGWGSCFADFDNDGWLDLFHTNGSELFPEDRSVLFMGTPNGTFVESSQRLGVNHSDQGRGVLCVDYNNDGKIDIFVANNRKSPSVYRNDIDNGNYFLKVKLIGLPGNVEAVGARVEIKSSGGIQMQEIQLGTGYLAQSTTVAHFGLGTDEMVESVEVTWPDRFRSKTRLLNIEANKSLEVVQPEHEELVLSVVDGSGTGIYEKDDVVTLEAGTPEDGYLFSHWTSSGGGSFVDAKSQNTNFTMPENSVTVTANYLPVTSIDPDVSVARLWIEVLLQAIRNDYARPTVHARNLFHASAAMYDAWTAYGNAEVPWLLGETRAGSECEFVRESTSTDIESARAEAISYASYRLILHRFSRSPGRAIIVRDADVLMSFLGFDASTVERDASSANPALLGNHIANCYITLGGLDSANEQNDYANLRYRPVNQPLKPELAGNPNITDLNRWQPLSLVEFIDQAGNPSSSEPSFIGAEWGSVLPFALDEQDLNIYVRDEQKYWVYSDPGPPPFIDDSRSDWYRWGFEIVSVWSAQLDPADGVELDTSPASLGNVSSYPTTFDEYQAFYGDVFSDELNGGHSFNPATDLPYSPNIVKRGDYTRVLAEFWADGPDSETPPGHWFVILNTVMDHPNLERRIGGEGLTLGHLEWDIKAYFTLGGAMHDAAIAAWGIKGWYDYIRPISAIRAMADRGQGSNIDLDSYHVEGIGLREGFIELIKSGDPLEGEADEHIGKIKLKAWRGPDFVEDPRSDVAGVGWVRAENWWPYQRPSFVTPPFAGYISGHSTYSAAAAEVLSQFTGSSYFPGGLGRFEIPAGTFLKFERGPSEAIELQWATYKDAADQCSLSRIWGGIHPPQDDIPGRLIGEVVGLDAYRKAELMFAGSEVD